MRIESSQGIAAFPAIQVRRLMRRIGGLLVTPARVSEILGCTTSEARRLLAKLDKERYVSTKDGERWEATVKGRALASATAAKPLRRATVKRLVSELLERFSRR